jgi:hypothetical protein
MRSLRAALTSPYLLLILSGCVQSQPTEITDGIRVDPVVTKIKDNVERTLFDYSTKDELGLIQVFAPEGWTEPIVSLAFETSGVVINGKLGLEFETDTQYFIKNEGFQTPKKTKVRIFNAGDSTLHMIEVLRPAYNPQRAQQFDSF